MIAARPGVRQSPRRGGAVPAAEDLVRVGHRDERAGRVVPQRSARAARSTRRTSLRRARATCDARWSVAPSASGSEYGSPTSSRSAPPSAAARAIRESRRGVGIAGHDVGNERRPAVGRGGGEGGGDPAGAGRVVRPGGGGRGRPATAVMRDPPATSTLEGGQVLVAATAQPDQHDGLVGQRITGALGARQQPRQDREGVGRLEGRQDPFDPGDRPNRGDRLGVGGRGELERGRQ